MSTTYESVNRIATLKANIEADTGKTYSNLTAAVQGLKNKYNLNDTSFIADTRKVTNFFGFCKNARWIEYLDKFNTSQGDNFAYMFDGCTTRLTSIPQLDTSNGTDFSYMFRNCVSLTSVPQLHTSKGTNFERMFSACSNLTSVPQLDTSQGTNFSYMLYSCSNLTSIPYLNTSQGTNFSYMFGNCSNLTSVPQLDTSNGTNFANMFASCSNLISIPQLDISKGISLAGIFSGCSKLQTVALANAPSNLPSTIFNGCTSLTNVTISQGWNASIYLHYSNNLTQESLHGMIENLADNTGITPKKTFQVGSTNLAKIDEEHIAMLNAKNWIYS